MQLPADEGIQTLLHKIVKLPVVYDLLRFGGKAAFRKSAADNGIPWDERVAQFEAILPRLEQIFEETENPNVEYPPYYLLPFHAYDEGNLNWKAAFEADSIREVIAVRLLKGDVEKAKTQIAKKMVEAVQVMQLFLSRSNAKGCRKGCRLRHGRQTLAVRMVIRQLRSPARSQMHK